MARPKKVTEKEPKVKREKPGRPTTYDPSICEKFVEYGKQGLSLEQIYSKLDILGYTARRWRKVHPEFDEAVVNSQTFAQGYWENRLAEFTSSRQQGNITALIFLMKSRFRDSYGDKQSVDVSGGINVDLSFNVVPDSDKSKYV